MTKEIQDKIDTAIIYVYPIYPILEKGIHFHWEAFVNGKRNSFRCGATFGYNLAQEEIERLKGLIENLWHEIERKDLVYAGMPLTDETIKEIDEYWQHFSKENNL